MRPFIVIGDKTSHGGVVIGSTQTTDTHGMRLARVGDQVTCPKKGHGTTVIVTGDPTMIVDGAPVARHGDLCACGAMLISSQVVSGVGEGGGSSSSSSASSSASATAAAGIAAAQVAHDIIEALFDHRFVLTCDLTDMPLAEAYTYNKRVNRLSAIQEHRMIVRAVDRGVSPETLANALDISKAAIIARFKLLDGICDEAIRLLADKPASRSMFNVLRQMKPLRQIDVSKSMIDLNNYSVKMAMAMLQATAPEQLLDEVRIKTQQSSSSDTLNRLRRELAAVQADTKLLEERYGPDNLQLVIIKTYIKTLLENAKVVRWLARTHGEYLHQLQLIADLENLAT